MRELILQRIQEIKDYHNGFNQGAMRWRDYKIEGEPIHTVDFSKLDDTVLLKTFEFLIRRHNAQM